KRVRRPCVFVCLDRLSFGFLELIEEKGYATPYKSSGKKLIAVGASFDEAKRNIGAWKAKEL
ncbi:MAG: hypothetical protein ACFNQF_08655, partial [Bacteroides sp.]